MPDQQNETPGNSTGSHPSDRNKDVRWMGHSSSPVGPQDGGRPIRSKNARSTKRNARKFHGLPPIGQKQRRPMDGAQFIPSGSARRWETDKKQKCQINKTKRQEIPRAPTHRTETKTSDGWGTVHPQWVRKTVGDR